MPAAPSSARRIASISASPAAATPMRPARCTIRTRWATRPAARRRAARCVVALGEVDMAIGGDQGGSIRMPSSFSGIYGMKPTYGLVPYTGVMPIEIYRRPHRPDDRERRRQRAAARSARRRRRLRPAASRRPRCEDYTKALGGGVKGMKIGVVKEGFGQAGAEAAVDAKVRRGGQAAREPRRHRRGGLDPDAPDRAGDLDADRRRRHRPDHDVRRRLWSQPAGSLRRRR